MDFTTVASDGRSRRPTEQVPGVDVLYKCVDVRLRFLGGSSCTWSKKSLNRAAGLVDSLAFV